MSTRGKRGEITTFIVLGILALIGVATLLNTSLNQQSKTVNTNAQAASCPYDSGQAVPLGTTETNTNNMENRWPISTNRHEYDFYSYFVPATIADANSSNMPVASNPNGYTSFINEPGDPPGGLDPKSAGMLGKMFGYKPNQLTDAYFMKYKDAALQGADTLVKGTGLALKVPINPGDPVKMPDTPYDIGGGKEGLVVFAAADRITIHISRAEYIRGSGGLNCNGQACSGGYWIYIRGICVDQRIQNAYNSAKANQEAAGANKTPIQLPEIAPNQTLGLASGNAVEVIVRDDGPLISIHKPFYWQGAPAKDFGAAPTATPVLVASPTPTTPAGGPTPTIPAGAICGYPSLRCCNPSDPVVPGVIPGTSCHPSATCVSGNCVTPTPSPTSTLGQCGNVGQICCSSTMPGYTGVSCYNGATCSANNICTAVGPPTVTNTPVPQGTWTPTPTPNAPTPLRQLCSKKAVKGKYNVVFLPNNYSDYNAFASDVGETITSFESIYPYDAIYTKFSFILFSDVNRSYNVKQLDPAAGKKIATWDNNMAKTSMRICSGDAYIIIQNTPRFEENQSLAQLARDYWGGIDGFIWGLGNGEGLIMRYKLESIKQVLVAAFTGVLENQTLQMWQTALQKFQ